MSTGSIPPRIKRVILMRHAKSSWSDPTLSDQRRPLAGRGRKDAPAMGLYLLNEGYIPQHIFCSSAMRTFETARLVMEKLGLDEELITYSDKIYEEGEDAILRVIHDEIDPKKQTVMIVGHNPDMENLVEYFTGEPFPYPKFSTCAVAVLDFKVSKWKHIYQGKGSLVQFTSPGKL
jgi:phosphohistidine phosphatase